MRWILEKIKNIFYGKVIFQKFANILYRISLRLMNFGSWDMSMNGEIHVLEHLTHLQDPIIFDVGANQGQYASLIDSVFHGKAKIYSFEPAAQTYLELVKNVSNIKNIKTYNFGFGASEEKIDLHYDEEGSGQASVYKRRLDHMGGHWNKKEQIELKTLDNFCVENSINRIDLLKLDIEGHEFAALKGAMNMIKKGAIRTIQFEFGGTNIDSRTFFQDFYYLLKDQYSIYRIVQNGLYKMTGYSEKDEIFTMINYFAALK